MGILENNLKKSEMIDYTLNEWQNYEMPKDFVVIEHEGEDGELVCLRIDEKNPDNSPVISYIHPEIPITILAPDFGTFFLDWVKEEIEIYHEENPDVPRKF